MEAKPLWTSTQAGSPSAIPAIFFKCEQCELINWPLFNAYDLHPRSSFTTFMIDVWLTSSSRGNWRHWPPSVLFDHFSHIVKKILCFYNICAFLWLFRLGLSSFSLFSDLAWRNFFCSWNTKALFRPKRIVRFHSLSNPREAVPIQNFFFHTVLTWLVSSVKWRTCDVTQVVGNNIWPL